MKDSDRYRSVAGIVSSALILALAVCAVTWRIGRPGTTMPGLAAALASIFLFAVLGVRWIFSWMNEWQGLRPPTDADLSDTEVPHEEAPCCEADYGSEDADAAAACTDSETVRAEAACIDTYAGSAAKETVCVSPDAGALCDDEDAVSQDSMPVSEDGHSCTPDRVDADDVTNDTPLQSRDAAVPFATMAKVFLLGVCACVAGLLLVYLFQLIAGHHQDFGSAAQIWSRLDSQHYFDIARDWYLSEGDYGRIVQLVFLPGFPVVLRAVTALTGNMLLSGILISILSFSFGCVVLYKLVLLDADRSAALRAVKFAMLLPGAFFMASPMSDALFFLLSVSCVYFIRRNKWLAAGLVGAAATFTRTLGLVLLVPAVYTMVTQLFASGGARIEWRKCVRYLAILLIPVGFAGYCFICWQVSGNPFQFLIYQREHWGQTAGYFFNTAAYQTERAISVAESTNWSNLFGLWLPNLFCSFFALAVMALSVRRMRPSDSLYFIGYYVIAIGVTWLLSAPRYLAACFPICIGLAHLTRDRKWDTAVTIGLTVVYTLYAMMMANRWQVW